MENAPYHHLRNIPRYVRLGQKLSWSANNAADMFVDAFWGRTFYSHMFHDPQPQTVLHVQSESDLNNISLACDSDYGGSSRIDLDLSPDLGDGSERWAVCKGRISLAVRKEVEGKVRGGWVGFRTIKAPADPLWMTPTRDICNLTHLSVLVRPKGDPHLWPHWFVNIKSASTFFHSDLHTHRLGITGSGELGDGWEECLVPLSNLVHLRGGEITTNQHEPGLDRMTTIGFSLLGAPRQSLDRRSTGEVFKNPRSPYGLEGNFHLDIGPVRAVYQQIHFTNNLPPVYRFPPSLAHYQARIDPPPPLVPIKYPSFKDSYYRNALQATYERGSYPPYDGLPGLRVEAPQEEGAVGGGEEEERKRDSKPRRKAGLSEEATRRALEEL
ncbi:hypothetical protein BDY24DRAFT_388482 [Mrakia frigida]|uniref:uncharacterized protein n=1 Tax=Mrakia frigida TaxID=29902 RepID=UPI003FCC0CDA